MYHQQEDQISIFKKVLEKILKIQKLCQFCEGLSHPIHKSSSLIEDPKSNKNSKSVNTPSRYFEWTLIFLHLVGI